jgi:hypothetical protein
MLESYAARSSRGRDIVEASRRMLGGRDEVSRTRRALSLILCGAGPALLAIMTVVPLWILRYAMPADLATAR